jgi:hypothetical protein
MNIEELEEALSEILPGFHLGTSKTGEVVIYSGLTEDEDGELLPIDDDDDEPSFDADTEQLEDEGEEDD